MMTSTATNLYQNWPSCAYAAASNAPNAILQTTSTNTMSATTEADEKRAHQPHQQASSSTTVRHREKKQPPKPDYLATAHKASVRPVADWRLLTDSRVVASLIEAEERCGTFKDCFRTGQQTYVTEPMRTKVVDWMLEVCVEERKDAEVYPLAVQLLDRFLAVENIFAEQLQSLASAALLTAGKVKLAVPFTATRLVEYTDNSVALGELVSWELLVLSRLKWDVSSVTAFDYLEHMLCRLCLPPPAEETLRRRYTQLAQLIVREYRLASLPPSLQAAMCITVAVNSPDFRDSPELRPATLYTVSTLLQFDTEMLRHFVDMLEQLITTGDVGAVASPMTLSVSHAPSSVFTTTTGQPKLFHASTTPTDIQDVFLG